ncbi:MAG: Cys-tRNA(Pro) deacylase [Clostridia bacterium]|nr:Cys-tRNA(Pro) deacylase [Clostridia bacterium]
MKKAEPKTNAMRELEAAHIAFEPRYYDPDIAEEERTLGETIANTVGLPAPQVFKTLVGRGDRNGINVFCIPVCAELDMKRAAAVSGNKKFDLLAVKELLPVTGYVRGGCSPIGMRKKFPVYIESSALRHEIMTISAGMRGCQLALAPKDLFVVTGARAAENILR